MQTWPTQLRQSVPGSKFSHIIYCQSSEDLKKIQEKKKTTEQSAILNN